MRRVAPVLPARELRTLAHVDSRPTHRVRFGLAKHFACDRSRIAFAEREEFQQVGNWISLGPSKVGVRNLAGLVAAIEEQRRNRIRNRWTHASQHAMTADLDAG